jgi:hypothetical protein
MTVSITIMMITIVTAASVPILRAEDGGKSDCDP